MLVVTPVFLKPGRWALEKLRNLVTLLETATNIMQETCLHKVVIAFPRG